MSLRRNLRKTGLGATCLFTLGGLLFALGELFQDPGGSTAALVTAAILVPTVGLTFVVHQSPLLGLKVLVAAVAVFAVWAVITLFVDIEAPTIPIIALVLALPIAVAGQRYAKQAGELLIAVAAVPLLLLVMQLFMQPGREGASLRGLLGTSTGVVVIPLALLALVFLAAGAGGRDRHTPEKPPVQPPMPADRR